MLPTRTKPSNLYVGEAQTFSAFTTMMRSTSPIPIDTRAEGPVAAEITQRTIDQMVFATVSHRSHGLTVSRDDEAVRRSPSPVYMLVHQLDGESAVQQMGRTAHLQPGEFTVTNCSHPHELTFASDARVFIGLVVQSQLDVLADSIMHVTATPFDGRDAANSVASAYFRSYAEALDRLEGQSALQLTRNLVDLLSTVLVSAVRSIAPERTVHETSLLNRVTEHILENLSDPELTPRSIADAHFISTRRLHALFQNEEVGVARWIRDRRLRNCRWDLSASQNDRHSVYEIAARWGFTDPAYFSRIFREEFGESPRQWRARSSAARPLAVTSDVEGVDRAHIGV